MSYKVRGGGLEKLNLAPSTTEAVLQNVAVLLATPQYSVPLDRGFGLPQRFLDRPIQLAKPILVAEVLEAVAQYEPRAEIVNIEFELDDSAPGTLIPIVEVNIRDG